MYKHSKRIESKCNIIPKICNDILGQRKYNWIVTPYNEIVSNPRFRVLQTNKENISPTI